jgi:hypothetical protein
VADEPAKRLKAHSSQYKHCERPGCSNLLTGKQKRFCSNACRATYTHDARRRLAESVALAEVREQVGPVVREALTDRVLEEIKVMTHLLPEALQTLQNNLLDEDPKIRESAAALILKYTLGNQTIAPKPEQSAPAFNISFGGMPMQGEKMDAEDGSVLGDAVEEANHERQCQECGEVKDAAEFVGESPRCLACHDRIMDEIGGRFPGLLPSGS